MAVEGQGLDDFLEALGLQTMRGRPPETSPLVEKMAEELRAKVPRGGKMLIGLYFSFVVMADRALDAVGEESLDRVFDRFSRQEKNRSGRPLNTLNLVLDDEEEQVIRLRGIYDKCAHVFRNELRRYDYPNSGPHSTQAWQGNVDVLEGVFALTPGERRALAERIWSQVLELPEHRRRSVSDARPRPFEILLDDFESRLDGEPRGAVLQGLAFAYYRADSPTVTVDTGKVGAGSRRVGRIGDVDGWNGAELEISIEVKDEDLKHPDDPDLGNFIANLAGWPDSVAIVVARSASPLVRVAMEEQNVLVLDRGDLLQAVVRWDLSKQQLATREFHHFLVHIQQHGPLIERFEDFARDRDFGLEGAG
jgi:hypothetical protein